MSGQKLSYQSTQLQAAGAIAYLIAGGLALAAAPACAATYQVLHRFNGTDGAGAISHLILATDGNFYGTTQAGGTTASGAAGFGTVYRISPKGGFKSIYTFTGGADGSQPSGLMQAKDKNFYGITAYGGAHNAGTVFKLSLRGVLTTINAFQGGADGGGNPGGITASLAQGADLNLYGTSGAGPSGAGTLFKITTSGARTILHSFTNGSDGGYPEAALTLASDGNFYGTTSSAGTFGGGTIYQVTPAGGFNVIYSIDPNTSAAGFAPYAGLVQGADGYLYGCGAVGGIGGGGLFKLTTGGLSYTTIASFGLAIGASLPGAYPYGTLLRSKDGYLYGVTQYTDPYTQGGTLFKILPDGSNFSDLVTFSAGSKYGSDPISGVVESADGTYLIGTAGVVFKYTK